MEYESIRIVASAMNISLDYLTEMLTDCEARQQDLVSSMSLQANVVQHTESDARQVKQFGHGSRSSYRGGGFRGRGRGRKFTHAKPQYQLCGRVGHTVHKCYYRFDESFEGVSHQSMQVQYH
ncbi:hypothetical protein Gotur_023874, partial [Gossypium turneri]